MQKQYRRDIFFGRVLPLLLLIAAILLFFNKMAFSNLILARGDTFLYFYPYWQVAADALRAGHVPLWNPAIFMGAPFLANSQSGFFYPPNWPVWTLLRTPYAASASILFHLIIAGCGTFLAARRWLVLSWPAALLAALSFALGGYLTAQVEHINQVQGLAWLPWYLWVLGGVTGGERRTWLRAVLGLAALFSLQLLAGHTQTLFISGVAVVVWITAVAASGRLGAEDLPGKESWLARTAALAVGGGLALLLTAVQLLPTLELAGLSSREGGLAVNEVLSFSLSPVNLTRALLPAYGQSLFSEYVAFLPLTFLALAFIGAWQWRRRAGVVAALALAATGVCLAFGVFNPLYWLLARLPGFDLFRAPARWLALYALGVALLVGLGWQVLVDTLQRDRVSLDLLKVVKRPLFWFAVTMAVLMAWGWLAGFVIGVLPSGAEAPYEAPTSGTVVGWALELLLLFFLLFILQHGWMRGRAAVWLSAVALLGLSFLFLASRALPYNHLTTPEAYFDLRPSTTRLLAAGGQPPDRFLSLSDIFFDPGDQTEIDSIYADQLSPEARYDYTIAIKQKEIIAPNLPMVYGLEAVDGFDGGILPLKAYSQQMQLLLPPGIETTDGRLREQLLAVPAQRWLDLYNARYLITDKVGDEWRDGVFYDRQHPVALEPGDMVAVGYVPTYEATELRLLATGQPARVTIITAAGEAFDLLPSALGNDLYEVLFPEPLDAASITIEGCVEGPSCSLQALTLVDTRDDTFQTLVPGDYRLIHSGDVKIYENLSILPRAFLVYDWQWVEDVPGSVAIMRNPDFVGSETAVLVKPLDTNVDMPPLPAPANDGQGTAEIVSYEAEEVLIRSRTDYEAMLLLSDAAYPGWTARVDGRDVPIFVADGLFRAVYVPAGKHEIQFTFAPRSYSYGRWLTLSGLLLFAVIALSLQFRKSGNNL